MTTLARLSTTAILAGALLFCILAGVAALDELARVPFYRTLPIVALFVNAVSGFLLLRGRNRIGIKHRLLARLVSLPAVRFRLPRFAFGGLRREQSSTNRAGAGTGATSATRRTPSPQQIEAALRNVHSVVLGFPFRNPPVNPLNREEALNDEAHQ
jgi:hypothetical protein